MEGEVDFADEGFDVPKLNLIKVLQQKQAKEIEGKKKPTY